MELLFTALEWIRLHPGLSGPVFVLLVAGVMAIGVPGGLFLLLASGLLFGWLPGTSLSVLGLLLAALATHALLTHAVARTTAGRWLEHRAERWAWLKVAEIRRGNLLLLLLPRWVPVFPFFALNVVYALAGVPRLYYLGTTLLGVLPIALLLARVGSQFSDLEAVAAQPMLPLLFSTEVLGPLLLLILLSGFAGWLYSRLRKSKAGAQP